MLGARDAVTNDGTIAAAATAANAPPPPGSDGDQFIRSGAKLVWRRHNGLTSADVGTRRHCISVSNPHQHS